MESELAVGMFKRRYRLLLLLLSFQWLFLDVGEL